MELSNIFDRYKYKMEFDMEQIKELIKFSEEVAGIKFFASVWDKDSVDLMAAVDDSITKIPSALITDLELCAYARSKFKKLIISTGISAYTPRNVLDKRADAGIVIFTCYILRIPCICR